MEEDEISDALYGDLGDFDFNEKLKEQNIEIASLTERLNQSVVTITELQNKIKELKQENRTLKKNTSSLLVTAKLEISRKTREISALQQKFDNRVFRRSNYVSVGYQTDVTNDPSFHSNSNNNHVNSTEYTQQEHSIMEKCSQLIPVTVSKSTTFNDTRPGFSNFRIPKKNSSEKHVIINEPTNAVDVCKTEKLEEPQIVTNDDSKRQNLPKKNPFARRLDADEEKSSAAHNPRSSWIEDNGDKSKFKSRRDHFKDNRKRSPTAHASSRQHADIKSTCPDDQRRYNQSDRNRRKHSRGRDSSDEKNRHSKRPRSDSKSYRHRSRSTTSRNQEKHCPAKCPKDSNSKSRKNDRIEDVVLGKESIFDLKEQDLEAMLIAQRKVLEQIDSEDNKEAPGTAENTKKERHKRKMSNSDVAEKLMNQEQSHDIFNCANEEISNTKLITGFNDTSSAVAKTEPPEDQNTLNKNTGVPEIVEAPPVATNNFNFELPPAEAFAENKSISSSPPKEMVSSPLKPTSEIKNNDDEVTVLNADKFHSNENSNSRMDIDYELMALTSIGGDLKSVDEEVNKELLVEGSSSPDCLTVNKDAIPESLSSTHIRASFIAMENRDPEECCISEDNLNGSFERHILSKSCEYTVQDVGHEVRIYLTKKRKKSKNVKITS